ncbi:hypothetical protein ACF0H5_006867 [Mactra antiquata]
MEVLPLLWLPVGLLLKLIEQFLFVLIDLYDVYCYSPLQTFLSPLVAKVPRTIQLRDRTLTIFNANIVSWTRTILVIPIAWCLKYDFTTTAFLCVILHDFLDHLDGIVAKVQKSIYGQLDDPILGGFMDAFCDKIVNCVSLWTILFLTDFTHMSSKQIWIYTGSCAVIIAYEFILGVVRVQDYFQAYYSRKYERQSKETKVNVSAVMEGKLKEKLESLGIGFLCLAQSSLVPMSSVSGIVGVACLLLSIRLAHASLMHKLEPRWNKKDKNDTDTVTTYPEPERKSVGTQVDDTMKMLMARQMSVFGDIGEIANDPDDLDEKSDDGSEKDNNDNDTLNKYITETVPDIMTTLKTIEKVDKVYTVGCFDLFHEGHKILIERLKQIGTQVIVGVHDSRSIFRLKKKVPIDGTSKRMANVKKYADVVFCIRGTDPTSFLKCMYDENEPVTSAYVRGDDMPNFPARKFIEEVMPVQFLPYSSFVSSTKIRKEHYNASMFGPHVKSDDHTMFY